MPVKDMPPFVPRGTRFRRRLVTRRGEDGLRMPTSEALMVMTSCGEMRARQRNRCTLSLSSRPLPPPNTDKPSPRTTCRRCSRRSAPQRRRGAGSAAGPWRS